MDAYFASDDQIHQLTTTPQVYLTLHVPGGPYLLLAKAHVATSMGEPVPPATEASLNGSALVRLKVGGRVADQGYATVTGQWDIGINHQGVSLMGAQEVDGASKIELEAVGVEYRQPIVTQLRLTALPLDGIRSGQGIEFKRDADLGALLRSLTAAGIFPQH